MSAAETNIQVVVRCRPKNDRELRESSPPIISFNSIRSKELHIRSILSDRNLTRSYAFDKVFSPEASQDLIYRDVVAPLLEEVLTGYNCTIFAYGQTGTGKTYTMEGSLQEVNGRFVPEAGMIPRALYSLFELLEAGETEYTVKVSCVELYNEELQDLLSPGDDPKKLRVFEDKKGVNIQGVEEVNVTSASDVLVLLLRANLKRRNAATQLNEHSSRSHAVYTITVFTKETTPGGEELLKTGKLNLVDLAGSENIGRSGAETKRAREAGMINQSLLTLGRVINALVEKSPHIPYRESKLTRLLQDSLGGRTKTCIIATISPARSHLEETQSTLDYAHRAKNIRNRPEVNQRMTKRALLSTYAVEIEKLKTDLQAARDKNGIFLTQERFTEMSEMIILQKQSLDQLKVDLELHEELLQSEKSMHAQSRKQLDQTKVALQGSQSLVEELRQQLAQSRRRTKEDTIVLNAMAQRDSTLRDLAMTMIENLKASAADLHHVHENLLMTRSFMQENKSAVNAYQNDLVSEIHQLSSKLTQFDMAQSSVTAAIESKLDLLSKTYDNYLSSTTENYQQLFQLIRDRFKKLLGQFTQYETLPTLPSIQTHFTDLQKDVLHAMEGLVSHYQDWSQGLQAQLTSSVGDVQGSYRNLQTQLAAFLSGLKEYFEGQRSEMQALAGTVSRLKSELVQTLVQAQEVAVQQAEHKRREHEKSLQHLIEKVSKHIQAHGKTYSAHLDLHASASAQLCMDLSSKISDMSEQTTHDLMQVAQRGQVQGDQLDAVGPTIASGFDQSRQQLSKLQTSLVQSLEFHEGTLQSHKERTLTQLESLVQSGYAQVDLAMDQRSTLHAEVETHVRDSEQWLQTEIQTLSAQAQTTQVSLAQSLEACHPATLADQCKSLIANVTQHTTEIEQSVTQLTKKRLRDLDDLPIPSKKRYVIPEPSDIPPPCQREALLEAHQVEITSPIPSPLLMPSKLPKPIFADNYHAEKS